MLAYENFIDCHDVQTILASATAVETAFDYTSSNIAGANQSLCDVTDAQQDVGGG